MPNIEPAGQHWGERRISNDIVEKAKAKNRNFLEKLRRSYSEIFISMGKEYAKALPPLDQYALKVIFPASGGLGPKARALSDWLKAKK